MITSEKAKKFDNIRKEMAGLDLDGFIPVVGAAIDVYAIKNGIEPMELWTKMYAFAMFVNEVN